ncbi:polysaccharide lyase 6 family protein [Chitinophagaceae bacterium LWZ2-11]
MSFLFTNATVTTVHDQQGLNAAIKNSVAGDTILLAKGEWKNLAIVFQANGTKDKPIVLSAESPIETTLTGNSYIKFAGNYLTVNGLHFTNGYAEAGAVVEFRKDDKIIANQCRFTNCVIDNYSKPERFANDSWIIFWGQHNRMDHCTIGDKLNGGTTLIVNLDDERSQQNYHSVDSNHFFMHSVLGSNGGETIRIGVSRYSLTASNTIVAHNYFEKCSGEVEIISVKSCYNKIYQNTFFECEGSIVLRHGNHNVVDGNLFICNNKAFTGGIRVINPNHTITNNLILNATGVRFRASLSVMNGVPNSQLNRYFQVTDANISNNSFINCASLEFGAGKDNERTAAPKNITFAKNFILTPSTKLYDDFNNDGGLNIVDNAAKFAGKVLPKGFTAAAVKKIEWNGLQFDYPVKPNIGADLNKVGFVNKNKVGASWYTPVVASIIKGKVIELASNQSKQLPLIVQAAGVNDTIVLTDTGRYILDGVIKITKPISVIAKQKAELVNGNEKGQPSFFSLESGGSLYVKNIVFNSAYESAGDVQSAVMTSNKGMLYHYTLKMENCEFFNFNENSYACFKANKSTYADSVVFDNCLFRNMSGSALDLSTEREDKGMYNAEKVIVRNCVFNNMLSGAINVYRGGNDESTTGPFVTIDHCTFNDVDNREQGCVIKLLGVQYARITNCLFNNSGQGGRCIWFEELGWDDVQVDYCNFYKSGRIESFYGKLIGKHILHEAPAFTDEKNAKLTLQNNSPLYKKASDGKNIGAK